MFPGITDIINHFFGTNISIHFPPTFGTIVAISFLLAAITLRIELRRKEKQNLLKGRVERESKGGPLPPSEIIWNAVFGFIIGFKLFYAISIGKKFFEDPASYIFSLKGNIVGAVLLAAVFAYLKFRESEKSKRKPKVVRDILVMPHHRVTEFAMVAALSGIIGAKLFHVLEDLDSFRADPLGMLFSGSGLTFYGGLIVASVAVLAYARKFRIPALHMCDATAPGLMLAYGFGRLGCQLSGDGDWGIENVAPKPEGLSFLPDWLWSFNYPNNVVGAGVPIPDCFGKYCNELPVGVFPTPMYEVLMGLGLFYFLWSIRKKITKPGVMFGIYLIVTGLERFIIEPIRVNTHYHFAGYSFSQAQLISVLLMIAGVITTLICSRKDFYNVTKTESA